MTKANADIELSGRQQTQAVFDQDQFRGKVDEFAYASFRGARFNEMSALLTSGSAEDFLHRMSALNVLATDGRASMDLLTGAVTQRPRHATKPRPLSVRRTRPLLLRRN